MFRFDTDVDARRQAILTLLASGQAAVGIVVAAADFERTVRRAIIALGREPTSVLRQQLTTMDYGTIKKYPHAWRTFVTTHKESTLPIIVRRWNLVLEAFDVRNGLLHGETGTVGLNFAREHTQVILEGTSDVDSFVRAHDVLLTKKLSARRKPRLLSLVDARLDQPSS